MAQDYNKTLNLPETDFPMRAGLPTREPQMLEESEKQRTYYHMVEKNAGKPLYVLHDGPPYANGDIHLGTRFKQGAQGYYCQARKICPASRLLMCPAGTPTACPSSSRP